MHWVVEALCKRNVEEYPLFSGLSILQNGKMARFLKPDVIESIFENSDCTPRIAVLRKGLAGTGVYQVRLYEKVCKKSFSKYVVVLAKTLFPTILIVLLGKYHSIDQHGINSISKEY